MRLSLRAFAWPATEERARFDRAGVERLGTVGRGRPFPRAASVGAVQQAVDRTNRAAGGREAAGSRHHELAHGESASHDGFVLSADVPAPSDRDRGTRVSVGSVRGKVTGAVSWIRSG